jgi:hypothetical protein
MAIRLVHVEEVGRRRLHGGVDGGVLLRCPVTFEGYDIVDLPIAVPVSSRPSHDFALSARKSAF